MTLQNYSTPLHLAAKNVHTKCVELLLSHGARADVLDEVSRRQWKKKHSKENDVYIVFFVGDFHTQLGRTPLHLAAEWNGLELIKMLLEHGADVDRRDLVWNTYIHTFSSPPPSVCRHLRLVRLMCFFSLLCHVWISLGGQHFMWLFQMTEVK
jgi:hypothetical protein